MQLIQPNWNAPSHVHAYSSTRIGGVSEAPFLGLNLGEHVGDNQSHVAENRCLLTSEFDKSPKFCWLNQTHSTLLLKVTQHTPNAIESDASWTHDNQRTCVVMTADCLPVLVTDKKGSFVAAIHAGWRGLCDGIIENSIENIAEELTLNFEDLLVWLGPCIGPTAFEVGGEVREQFLDHDIATADAFTAYHDKWLANLHLLAKLRLQKFSGMTITESTLCTFSEPDLFYSYRRDGQTGRMATFIWFD